MRKLWILPVAVVLIALGAGTPWAQDSSAADVQTLSGHVVCLNCYLAKGAMGTDHRKCALKCMGQGQPSALLVGSQLYLLESSHGRPYNKEMRKYAEKDVTVTGKVLQKDGMSVIEVKKMKKS